MNSTKEKLTDEQVLDWISAAADLLDEENFDVIAPRQARTSVAGINASLGLPARKETGK